MECIAAVTLSVLWQERLEEILRQSRSEGERLAGIISVSHSELEAEEELKRLEAEVHAEVAAVGLSVLDSLPFEDEDDLQRELDAAAMEVLA